MSRGSAGPLVTLAALLALSTPGVAAAAPPKVSASLEPSPIGRDELASFTLLVESSGFGGVEIEPDFRLDNLEIAGGPFQSQNMSWTNGVTASTTQLVWRLRPLGLGPAAVRGIRLKIAGELRQLADVAVEVVADAPPGRAAPPRRAAPDPFAGLFEDDPLARFRARGARPQGPEPELRIHSKLSPPTVFVGQQTVWQLILDTQTDVSRLEPRRLPDFHGFWVHDITPERPAAPQMVEIDGERFGRVPVLSRALFARQSGTIELPAVVVDVAARRAQADWFGPIGRTEPLTLRAEPLRLEVRPLPAPPTGFSGIVGSLTLTGSLDRTQMVAGQAATFVLRAISDGSLQAIDAPPLVLPNGLRSFPPAREIEEQAVDGRLQSRVSWSWVVLADRPGRYRLEALELTHFDPAIASYLRARSTPLELTVTGAQPAAEPASEPTAEASPAPGADPRPAPQPGRRWGAWASAAAGLMALALGLWLAARRRHGGRPAAALRTALELAGAEGAARPAAAIVEAGWRRFLEERWSIPRSLPVAQWREPLAAAGVDPLAVRELVELFEELHLLAYAPELADVESLRSDLLARSRRLLRRLR